MTISSACFWIDIQYFETLIAIGLTNLLTAIAFSLTITGSLPKVGYTTFIDGFITLSYIYIFTTIMEIIFVHYLNEREKKELATKIHRKARWILPAIFVLGNFILALIVFIPTPGT